MQVTTSCGVFLAMIKNRRWYRNINLKLWPWFFSYYSSACWFENSLDNLEHLAKDTIRRPSSQSPSDHEGAAPITLPAPLPYLYGKFNFSRVWFRQKDNEERQIEKCRTKCTISTRGIPAGWMGPISSGSLVDRDRFADTMAAAIGTSDSANVGPNIGESGVNAPALYIQDWKKLNQILE